MISVYVVSLRLYKEMLHNIRNALVFIVYITGVCRVCVEFILYYMGATCCGF